jgi:hypothetical protein
MNLYSNKSLSQKLERTEARANAEFVLSRLKMIPDSNVEWIDVNGTYAMFDGVESPLTQTFGLGLFNELAESDLEIIEHFYNRFSVPVFHEVSPMADPAHIQILTKKGYQPIEMTSILYKRLSKEDAVKTIMDSKITARKSQEGEENIWASISAEGWSTEMPDFRDFMFQFSQISASCLGASSFFANLNDKPISTGLVYIYDDVALLAGDSTITDGRNKGGQNALIDARLSYAADQGCTIAMIVASPGSQSQKNAEKNGFRIAYTRTKWKSSN